MAEPLDLIKFDLLLYLWIFFCSLMGCFMFGMWWYKIRKVSYIYKVVMGMMLGIFINNLGTFYAALYKYLGQFERVQDIVTSWWWGLRLVPLAFFITIFLAHMLWRFSNMDKFGRVNLGRRHDD